MGKHSSIKRETFRMTLLSHGENIHEENVKFCGWIIKRWEKHPSEKCETFYMASYFYMVETFYMVPITLLSDGKNIHQ